MIIPALPPAGDLLSVTATGDGTCRRVRAAGVHALIGAHRHAIDAGVHLRTRVGHAAVRLPLQSSGAWRLIEAEWTPTHARS